MWDAEPHSPHHRPCGPFYPAELDEAQKFRGAEQGRWGGKQETTTPCLQLNSIQERLAPASLAQRDHSPAD